MVIIDIVMNTLLGSVTRHPAGMPCPSWDDAFVSSLFFFVCHAPSPERRAFEGCIVRTRIALPFIGRFRRSLQPFFRNGLHFQTRYIVLTFVARWRHNFR